MKEPLYTMSVLIGLLAIFVIVALFFVLVWGILR
jgi:hypothetical protein